MRRCVIFLASITTIINFAFTATAKAEPTSVTMPMLLDEMVNFERLTRMPNPPYRDLSILLL